MGALIVIVVIIIALVLYIALKPGRGGASLQRALRQKLYQLLNLPKAEADEMIERQIKNLQERFPGKTEEWCLEKIIYDLERDRS